MYVEFEFSQEDVLDTNRRLFVDRDLDSEMLKNSVTNGLVTAAIIVLVFWRTAWGLLLGLIAGAMVGVFIQIWQKFAVVRRLNRLGREIMDGAELQLCQVEIRSEGVWSRAFQRQIVFEWAVIQRIDDESDAVVISAGRSLGGLVVRNRAFSSGTDRERFLKLLADGVARGRTLSSVS